MRKRLHPDFRRQTAYEWDFEEIDEHGDIVDHNHTDRLDSGHPFDLDDIEIETDVEDRINLVLIRDSGTEADGIDDRQWAYTIKTADGWMLPSHFDGGNVVPKKYHAELARWQAAKGETK